MYETGVKSKVKYLKQLRPERTFTLITMLIILPIVFIFLQLLDYVTTTIYFSDKNVDSNLISWNRVVLLHGDIIIVYLL